MKRLRLLLVLVAATLAAEQPTLVLIPGSFNGPEVFDEFKRHLGPGPTLIVELPLREKNPTVEGFADHVLRSIGHLKRFYVGGHSIGGMVAVEIAGRAPRGLLGVISMEGWTHHEVQAQAFDGDKITTLTPDQVASRESMRQRILSRITQAEASAFAAAWREWNGLPVLQSTHIPVLEIWGDRGRPRPARTLLRIPERDNIDLVWIAGSPHQVLLHSPRETALAVDRFLEANMYAARPMGKLNGTLTTIFRATDHRHGFNMHPYIAWHAGRFWAMWSTNRVRDLQSGQYVRFATSADGRTWSAPEALTPSEEGFRTFARGFWIRDGELIALAARDEAVRPLFGPGLTLLGYRWNPVRRRFDSPIVIAADSINNFPPRRLPNGHWLMSRRDHRMQVSMLEGGIASPSDWRVRPIPPSGTALDEPEWWTAANGDTHLLFRDGNRSRRLYRSINFSPPIRTNFPDAMAKFNSLRLSDGTYAMAHNPSTDGVRIPLALSLSEDGVVFDRTYLLRDEPTMYRYSGKDPGYRGYHYPQLLERNGRLYVIHSENMEDIQLLDLPVPRAAPRMRK